MIWPLSITWPLNPPRTWMPIALSTSVKPITPALVTVLLLLRVTAAPDVVTPIDPPLTMSMSAGAPELAVAVATGVLVDPVI